MAAHAATHDCSRENKHTDTVRASRWTYGRYHPVAGLDVIPTAETSDSLAGPPCHAGGSRYPRLAKLWPWKTWIPPFAGMTRVEGRCVNGWAAGITQRSEVWGTRGSVATPSWSGLTRPPPA